MFYTDDGSKIVGATLWMCDGCGARVLNREEHDRACPVGQPVLPYGVLGDANSGFAAGVATSEERARQADTDGTTSRRQTQTLSALGTVRGTAWMNPPGDGEVGGVHGMTWKELADFYDWHHGTASGVLSVLHKAGKIARLTERRNRCFVYVLNEYVNGRDTQEQGRDPEVMIDRLMDLLVEYDEKAELFGTSGAGAYFLAEFLVGKGVRA